MRADSCRIRVALRQILLPMKDVMAEPRLSASQRNHSAASRSRAGGYNRRGMTEVVVVGRGCDGLDSQAARGLRVRSSALGMALGIERARATLPVSWREVACEAGYVLLYASWLNIVCGFCYMGGGRRDTYASCHYKRHLPLILKAPLDLIPRQRRGRRRKGIRRRWLGMV